MLKKKVLVIEDQASQRDLIEKELCSDYVVAAPIGQVAREFEAAVLQFAQSPERFDFTILDMDFAGNPLGGITLFNRLRKKGVESILGKIVICSEHITNDILNPKIAIDNLSGNEVAYRVFLDTIDHPRQQVLNGRIDLWVSRLHNLLSQIH